MVHVTEKTVLIAAGVLAIAFIVWTLNAVDNSILVLLAGVGLLAAALMGNVEETMHDASGEGGGGSDLQHNPDFFEHPESFEEEAHETPAGH